jgi:uncharacterized repeat protein (TIGR01451 family)
LIANSRTSSSVDPSSPSSALRSPSKLIRLLVLKIALGLWSLGKVVSITAAPSCAQLPTGAVGWWPLNEQNGATSISELVGGHTGVPVSGPVGPLGSNSPAPVTGMVGGALHFYQANTYVRVPNHPAFNFGAGDFTIDAWINPIQVNAQLYQPIVEKAQALNASGTSVAGYKMFVKNAKVHFAVSDGASIVVVAAPVAYGTWQFVVAERAGNTLRLFVNGTLAATAALPSGFGSTNNGADLLIGGITPLGLPAVPPIGEIDLDEVELFTRALMPAEIQAIYNAGPAGKCSAASGQPDPAVNKVMINPSSGPVFPGQQITYQITVGNIGSGPFVAPYVGVSDPLPAGLTGVTFNAPPPWNCSISGNALMCQYPGPVTLNPGQQLPSITITGTVSAGVAGIKNCARIFFPNSGGADANPHNNLSCDNVGVQAGSGCVTPPSGMVAWWPLDETSGATATDIVGGFNGTAQPGPIGTTGSNPGPTTWLPTSFPPGMVGSSLFFGGKRHIRVPHNPALDPGTGSFAVDFWFIWGGGSGPIIQKMLPSGEGWGIFVVQNSTNPSAANIELRWKFASGISMPVLSLPIVSNQWYHLFAEMERNIVAPALSVLALNGTGFVNASLNVPPTETIATNADLLIGGDGINPGARIAVDEIEIFSRSLTVQEVQSIFNAGKAGKCKPQPSNKAKICIFKFNDLNGNGQKEANEPPLAGWQFNVNPAPLPPSTNPVTTGQQGGRCFGVSAPGTYTITESVQAGWTPTTSNPQTVNISPGQLVNVYFGNKKGVGCEPPPSGMVAWYWMDGSAIDTTILGGFNNPSATNAISFVAGRVGPGVTFGPGGYIDIPHSPALANQQFTIDAWVKPNGPGPNNDFWGSVIVQKGLPPPTGYTDVPISLSWSAQQQKFVFTFGIMTTERIVSSSTFPAGQWYHVAASYDGSAFNLYVNGALEAQMALVKTIQYSPAIPWTIGSTAAPIRAVGYPRTFNGIIDEVEIFNRALTQAEIQAIYNAGAAGKCKATLANPNSPSSTSRRAQRRRNLILGVAGTALGAVQIFQRRRRQSVPQPTDKVGTPTKTPQQGRP